MFMGSPPSRGRGVRPAPLEASTHPAAQDPCPRRSPCCHPQRSSREGGKSRPQGEGGRRARQLAVSQRSNRH